MVDDWIVTSSVLFKKYPGYTSWCKEEVKYHNKCIIHNDLILGMSKLLIGSVLTLIQHFRVQVDLA